MAFLSYSQAGQLLSRYKLPIVKSVMAHSEAQALKAASAVGYPVVLKAISPDVVHKSDKGLVMLDLKSVDEAKAAYALLSKRARKLKLEGILVMKMALGLELIIGMKRDAQFGPAIMFGLGGIFVEAIKEVTFRITPVSSKDALEMIRESSAYGILSGARSQKYDVNGLANIIVKLSRLASENSNIDEVDFNPVIVNAGSAEIVDVRVRQG